MAAIGYVGSDSDPSVDAVDAAIVLATGYSPDRLKLRMLAGPNEALQIILDLGGWTAFGGSVLIWLAGKVRDDIYDYLKAKIFSRTKPEQVKHAEDISKALDLLLQAQLERQKMGGNLQLRLTLPDAVEHAHEGMSGRGVYIDLPNMKPGDEVRLATILAEFAALTPALSEDTEAEYKKARTTMMGKGGPLHFLTGVGVPDKDPREDDEA